MARAARSLPRHSHVVAIARTVAVAAVEKSWTASALGIESMCYPRLEARLALWQMPVDGFPEIGERRLRSDSALALQRTPEQTSRVRLRR